MAHPVVGLVVAGVAGVTASEFVAGTDWHVKEVDKWRTEQKPPATKGEGFKTRIARYGAAAGAIGVVALIFGSIKPPKAS